MAELRLQDELLKRFREERALIDSQISLLEPVSSALSRPAILRWANRGLGFVSEMFCWLVCAALIVSCFFLKNIFPFYLLFELDRNQYQESLGRQSIQALQWGVYGLIILSALLFAVLARSISRIHHRNDLLHQAAVRINKLLDQNKKRQKELQALDERHFGNPSSPTEPISPV